MKFRFIISGLAVIVEWMKNNLMNIPVNVGGGLYNLFGIGCTKFAENGGR